MSSRERIGNRSIEDLLAESIYTVEATGFEILTLWRENRDDYKLEWKQFDFGKSRKLWGEVLMTISFTPVRIGGHLVVFWEVTSQLADFEAVAKYIEKHSNGSKTDPMNFSHVIHKIQELNS